MQEVQLEAVLPVQAMQLEAQGKQDVFEGVTK
jgi:hypothetical protein